MNDTATNSETKWLPLSRKLSDKLHRLVRYLEESEYGHHQENNCPRDHIWHDSRAL
jgi:hypothetical protein